MASKPFSFMIISTAGLLLYYTFTYSCLIHLCLFMSALMSLSTLLQVGHSAFEDQGNGSPNDFRSLFKDIFDNDNLLHDMDFFSLEPSFMEAVQGCAKTVTFPAAVACGSGVPPGTRPEAYFHANWPQLGCILVRIVVVTVKLFWSDYLKQAGLYKRNISEPSSYDGVYNSKIQPKSLIGCLVRYARQLQTAPSIHFYFAVRMAIFSGFLNCFFPCSSSQQVSDDVVGGSSNKEPSSKDSKKGKSKSSSLSSSGAPIVVPYFPHNSSLSLL
ncbi:unnamed protein product [Prunus armeniaca]